MNLIPKVQDEQEIYIKTVSATSESNSVCELINNGGGSKLPLLQPPPHPLPTIPGEKVIFNPAIPAKATERHDTTSSIKDYTVALLQQYTNSFSQENYIGEGSLGPVYRAELPDGKVIFFFFICK